MKKLLIIKGMFNDQLTGYQDKESSVQTIVDQEKDCTCSPTRKCVLCKLIDKHGLTDIPENYKI